LKSFDVPVLCMTATLQKGRKSQLAPLVETVYEERPGELARIAEAPRYRVSRVEEAEAEQRAAEAVRSGQRVLWVVNQVSRAQSRCSRLQELLTGIARPICYHSRFKLDDRVDRHRETVDAIKAGRPAAVVVSTQVCEMSLD